MSRPRKYFKRNQYTTARRTAQERGKMLFLFERPLRSGKKESGYYVGAEAPTRWTNAMFERKKT